MKLQSYATAVAIIGFTTSSAHSQDPPTPPSWDSSIFAPSQWNTSCEDEPGDQYSYTTFCHYCYYDSPSGILVLPITGMAPALCGGISTLTITEGQSYGFTGTINAEYCGFGGSLGFGGNYTFEISQSYTIEAGPCETCIGYLSFQLDRCG